MANDQEQHQSPAPEDARVVEFEEKAKKELRTLFAAERAQIRLELKRQKISVLLWTLIVAGAAFLAVTGIFLGWLIFGAPCTAQILGFLAAIAALLIVLLVVFLSLAKFMAAGFE